MLCSVIFLSSFDKQRLVGVTLHSSCGGKVCPNVHLRPKYCSEAAAKANEVPLFCWSSENQYPITVPGWGWWANEIWTSLLWFHIRPYYSLLTGISCLKCIPSFRPRLRQAAAPAVWRCLWNTTLAPLEPHFAKYDVTTNLICRVSVAHGQRILLTFNISADLTAHLGWQRVGKVALLCWVQFRCLVVGCPQPTVDYKSVIYVSSFFSRIWNDSVQAYHHYTMWNFVVGSHVIILRSLYFACCFTWIRNLISHSEGRICIEGVEEQTAAENVWT
jgi:hypothetical protein